MRFASLLLLLAALLSATTLSAQGTKGAHPVNQSTNKPVHQTRAVVIGISDYQDADIPDLRFADKDAEAFANFLRSPAGGALDGDHLKVLTNQNATAGRIAEALDWLVEQSREGDRAFIYFSGHGDVERKLISQPGFLLCWDAPARVYMGGGTYSLAYLQEVVTTLAVQNKARVVVFSDACHAGKLAGSQIGGSQLTAANMAKQFSNEVKILSCQPNEYSLEGEQWGGGRGVFSYHLVDGLFGLADRNADQMTTLGELDRYLEDHVTAEAAPQSQVPMLLGSKTEPLAVVAPQILANLKMHKSEGLAVFMATEGRGFEEEILGKVDSNIREMYQAFKLAVQEKRFFAPSKNVGEVQNLAVTNTTAGVPTAADALYDQLIGVEALAPLRGMMKRNYAAALQDDAQRVLNDLVRHGVDKSLTDAEAQGISYTAYPRQLDRAAELLGQENYFYPSLRGRKALFESFLTSDPQLAMAKCRESLTHIPEFPLAYWRMAYLQRWKFAHVDSSLIFIHKAIQTAPTWVRAYTDYALYTTHRDSADLYLQKAYEMDSTSAVMWYSRGLVYSTRKEMERAAEAYERAIGAATQDGICFPCAYRNLSAYWSREGDLKRAEGYLIEGLKTDSLNSTLLVILGSVYKKRGLFDKAINTLNKALKINPRDMNGWALLTYAFLQSKQYEAGEAACKQALEIINADLTYSKNASVADIYENYADILAATARREEALGYYRKAFAGFFQGNFTESAERVLNRWAGLDPENKEMLSQKFDLAVKKDDRAGIILVGKKLLALDSSRLQVLDQTAYALLRNEAYEEAVVFYQKSVRLDSSQAMNWINLGFCLCELKRHAEGQFAFRKAILIDSTGAIVWNNLGSSYLETGRYAEAEQALQKAIAINPTFANPRKHLGMVFFKTNRPDEARQNFLQAIALNPNYAGAMLGMAYLSAEALAKADAPASAKASAGKEAIGYVEQAIGKGSTFEQLEADEDLAPLRALPEWKTLMKKHFPDMLKD
ncbi:MAG: tetratricopeptide repeat protein [Saprospiraceae bacterium]|jgi:tetratricopeptide (TPR) repeat protein/uncharacterized caspase-like protein|nr:tetratricopeptide repeat protein [Saprospiraceae bacterium]